MKNNNNNLEFNSASSRNEELKTFLIMRNTAALLMLLGLGRKKVCFVRLVEVVNHCHFRIRICFHPLIIIFENENVNKRSGYAMIENLKEELFPFTQANKYG